MFDILIGTLIPAYGAVSMIKQLNPKGFESYELNFADSDKELNSIDEFAKKSWTAQREEKFLLLHITETQCVMRKCGKRLKF